MDTDVTPLTGPDTAPAASMGLPALSRAASRRLARTGWAAVIAAIGWLCWRSPLEEPVLILLGGIIILLAAWPALQWAARAREWFPVFELSMLTGAVFYGMPLLRGRSQLLDFSENVMITSAWVFVGFQICAILGFNTTTGRPTRNPALTTPLLPDKFFHYAAYGMWINTAYLLVANYTDVIPFELNGTIRAVCAGIGTVATFLLSYRLGARQLTRQGAFVFALNLVAQMVLLLSTLYLISSASLLLLALVGYVASSRRVPLVPMALGLVLLTLLHNGKSEMRRVYWHETEEEHRVELMDLPAFFSQWIEFSLTQRQREEQGAERQSQLVERVSLFHMLCLVVDRVPEIEPYLDGASYVDIPALLVPRVLWPEKPSALQSNVRLALHFNLVTEEAASSVSIAFGPVAEAYANFGAIGAAGFGVIMGWFMKRAVLLASAAPQFSAVGLFMILLTAWCFQVEQVAATWISSLMQAAIAVIGLPLVLRRFFGL